MDQLADLYGKQFLYLFNILVIKHYFSPQVHNYTALHIWLHWFNILVQMFTKIAFARNICLENSGTLAQLVEAEVILVSPFVELYSKSCTSTGELHCTRRLCQVS